ncbi:MAG: hypothetical protein L5655_12300, partial [Thermosediminibacteraceae bacterium]|nr:hypothetical protein [Thermosediminibacteraceae bacterium]
YRKGMTKEEALNVLDEMAESFALDANIVSLLKSNFDEVNSSRIKAQMISTEQYRNFYNASIQH